MVLGSAHFLDPVHKELEILILWNGKFIEQIFPPTEEPSTYLVEGIVLGAGVWERGLGVSEADTSHLDTLGLCRDPTLSFGCDECS